VVAVHLSRNHGQQLALTAGLSVCRGDDILVIDADLQDPPELVGEMLARRAAGADVVYGKRRRRAGETAFKRTTSYLFYRGLAALTEADIPQDTGDFRLMSRRVVDWLLAMPERRRFVRGMVSWIGFRQEPLLYDRDPRVAGETKWPLRQLLRLAIDAVTSFSIKPLLAAAWLAGATGILAAGCALWATATWISGAAAGGVALAALMLGLSAVQFVVLAIQGQYLGRLCEQSRDRPLFIIDRIEDAAGRHAVAPPRPTSTRQRNRAA
jgi:dolichol-phosphate mannosyltransferase